MQKRESNIVDIDVMMNERFGAVGTESRSEFRKEAYNYCVGQLILEARRQESMTQAELAEKIGYSERGLKNAVIKDNISKPMERALNLLIEVELYKNKYATLEDKLETIKNAVNINERLF